LQGRATDRQLNRCDVSLGLPGFGRLGCFIAPKQAAAKDQETEGGDQYHQAGD
jgi:hypothetical protein